MKRIGNMKLARMCPVCDAGSIVYDTREQPDGSIIRKRRCKACGVRFMTMEILLSVR